jgi:glutamine amidotransferase
MIAIIDYGMGNLRSVEKSFLKVGVDARIVTDAASIDNADGVVLPGVGAFMDCIKNLTDMKLTEAIIKSIRKGKPYSVSVSGFRFYLQSQGRGMQRIECFKGKVVDFPKVI